MFKVYYLMHSCFLVELKDRYILFDYFDKDSIKQSVDFSGCLPKLDEDKFLYVFASNGRKDHWWSEVLNWAADRENIYYVLSKDTKSGFNYFKKLGLNASIKDKITYVSPLKKYQVKDMVVETLRSNDLGVAFVISIGDFNIYYAGDLNWWNASGRGELYGELYGREYKRALRGIENRRFDIGFVVMDSRMGEDGYYLGMEYFLKNIECDNIFPMHMWGDYKWIERFKKRPGIANLKDRIVDIDRENMIFEIED